MAYVALSYRWGELQETLIDTQVGYIASVTSFHLEDFYELCLMMTHEADLQHIKYVWVDAICVDQTNYVRRKSTIYQMTNIYDQASYIVAVPDLHAAYLRRTLIKNVDIMDGSRRHGEYIYHLIHGNVDQLAIIEKTFLDDDAKVPNDPVLRQWLTKYTDHFMDGFMKYKGHYGNYDPVEALDHIYETSLSSVTSSASTSPHYVDDNHDDNSEPKRKRTKTESEPNGDHASFEKLHHCANVDCPLNFFDRQSDGSIPYMINHVDRTDHRPWKQLIHDRSTSIRQSMEFLTDLIVDWSSRVWVISEYHLAKKKNNLKFWFTQLMPDTDKILSICCSHHKGFLFFKFDFDGPSAVILNTKDDLFSTPDVTAETRSSSSNPVYLKLHHTLMRQLNRQTFLEMILKSNASKNEDRFYSILPLSEYQRELVNKNAVDQWNINTLLSVKLKLFEFMTTRDKLNLLFMSCNKSTSNIGRVLPTFATSTISSATPSDYLTPEDDDDDNFPCNFDLANDATILFHQPNNDTNDRYYYLNVKPMEYYKMASTREWFSYRRRLRVALLKRLQIHDDDNDATDASSSTPIDVLCIPLYGEKTISNAHRRDKTLDNHYIILVGNFIKNKWVLDWWRRYFNLADANDWTHHYFSSEGPGFCIY
ncbi:hypothetical protein BCR42DRAFT_426254 [Absidia repens]|uniref:Heterokaryon incompatibility domain-containing protein n=1 Tax=Absidia repens TaxID=90262 RepID=A0A1X2I1Z5_9FUNG|nr:hypothetical protein BCR42DRAFT_426254 [Absidia repens]